MSRSDTDEPGFAPDIKVGDAALPGTGSAVDATPQTRRTPRMQSTHAGCETPDNWDGPFDKALSVALKSAFQNLNTRLSEISCDEEQFDRAKGPYEKALKESGHEANLQYREETGTGRRRNRKNPKGS